MNDRVSPHIAPRGAMIAEDFARVRMLATAPAGHSPGQRGV